MRKITSLLGLLLLMTVGGNVVQATTYKPNLTKGRVTTLETGKQYMIYNTAVNGNIYGFIYADGTTLKTNVGSVPESFTTESTNYVWTLQDGDGTGQFLVQNVGTSTFIGTTTTMVSSALASSYSFTEFSSATNSSTSAGSRNDDGSTTAKGTISADNKVFNVMDNSGQEKPYWNGNSSGFVFHTNSHPFAVYEVEEETASSAITEPVTDRASAGDPMTFNDFKALAGTGKHFALMAPSSADLTYKKWFSFSKDGYPTTLTTTQLFTLEASTTADYYNIKRVSDGLYVSAEGGYFDATTKLDFKPVNRLAGDYAPEFSDASLHISLDNAAGNHYNANTSNLGFRAGTGGYSTYVAYGPFYVVNVTCYDKSDNSVIQTNQYIARDGTLFNAPEISPYEIDAASEASVTVNGADLNYEIYYSLPAGTVNVTYTVFADGVEVGSETVVQLANSEVSIPSSLLTETEYYDYTPAGTIGESDTDITVTRTVKAENMVPSIPEGMILSIGSATTTMTPATAAGDNDHWYILTQVRGGETPMYDNGNSTLMRAATSVTTSTLNGTDPSNDKQYLIRFFGTGTDGIYNIQFATGNFITSNLKTNKAIANAGNYAFYSTTSNGTWAWNLNSQSGSRVDNNGAGNTLSFWGSGVNTSASGNNIWTLYPVEFVDIKGHLQAAITSATETLNTLTTGANTIVVAYPNSTALAELSTAIAAAQAVYDDPTGDYQQGIDDLAAALATAQSVDNAIYIPRTDVYYTLSNANVPSGNRGSMVYDPSNSSKTDQDGNEYLWYSTSLDNTDVNHLWGFIEKDGTYYMYNVGKKQFAGVSTVGPVSGTKFAGGSWMFSDEPSSITLDAGTGNWVATPNVRVLATSAVTGNTYAMSISTSYTGPVITYDAVNDGGIPMAFAVSPVAVDPEVTAVIEALLEDLTPYRNALKDVIDATADIALGTGLNQYAASEEYDAALYAANSAYSNSEATKSDLQTALSNLEGAINNLVLNMPEAGAFYRIHSVAQDAYVSSTLDTSVSSPYDTYFTTNAEATDKGTIWYYNEDGKLLNYATGLNSGNFTAAAVGEDTGVTFDFREATNGKGKYWVHTSESKYWFAGVPTVDNYSSPQNVNNTLFTLEAVASLPVTISAAGYATFCAPVATTVPADVKAYKGSVNGGYLTLTEVEETIPAGEAVILEGNAGTYDFTIVESTATADAANQLSGTTAAIVAPENVYTLQVQGGVVGLYPYSGTNLRGFAAYLQNTSGIRGFIFNTTGVENPALLTGDAMQAYDVQGRRVLNLQKGGVYIINGKKAIVK